MAASIPDGVLVGTNNDPPSTDAEQVSWIVLKTECVILTLTGQGLMDPSIGVVEEGETLAKDNNLEKRSDGLEDQPLVLETGDNLTPVEERLPLPPQLVEMWTRIDSSLDSATTARVIQVTNLPPFIPTSLNS